MDDEIAVWFAGGRPVRLVWGGARYRVNDVPTPLTAADVLWHPLITHPPAAEWRGWRFQAVDDRGIAVVFDIRQVPEERRWRVVGLYGDRVGLNGDGVGLCGDGVGLNGDGVGLCGDGVGEPGQDRRHSTARRELHGAV